MTNLRSRPSLESLDARELMSATPVASVAGGLAAPVAYSSLSTDPRFGATTQDVEGASDFLADDIQFSAAKRVESFAIRYRAEVPVNAVVTFHTVDQVTGGPGAEVASFLVANLPATTGAPQNSINQSVTLPEAARFTWEPTAGIYKNSRNGVFGSNQTGGFVSVRFERLDGTVYESTTGGQIAAEPAGPRILDNQANGTGSLSGLWDLRKNAYNFGGLDYQPHSMWLQVGMRPVGAPTIATPQSLSFTLSADQVRGGQTLTATIELSAPAPAGGLTVQLASSNRSAIGPSQVVVIPAGATRYTFTLFTARVSANSLVTITATLGDITLSDQVTVTRRR